MNGRTIWENCRDAECYNRDVVFTLDAPFKVNLAEPTALGKACIADDLIERAGGVSLMRTGLESARGQGAQATSRRHSARAAERFCLKISRRFRWRSLLKWLCIEA